MDLSDSKVLILIAGAALLTPLGVIYCRESKTVASYVFIFLVVSTALGHFVDVNFFSYENYRGTARGIELTITDLITLVLLIHLAMSGALVKVQLLPAAGLHLLFVCVCVSSLYFSNDAPAQVFGWFVVVQYVRFLFVYWVVYSIAQTEKHFEDFISAIIITSLIVGAMALYERYGVGIHRVSGIFEHPNLLGAYANMLAVILFSLFFDFRTSSNRRQIWLALGCSLATVASLVTVSRAAIAALALGFGLIVMRALFTRIAWRKAHWLIVVFIVGSLSVYKVADTYMERFEDPQTQTWDGGRGAMNQIAVQMARNSLLGTGINNYSYTAVDYGGKYLPPASYEHGLPPVHSIYFLTLGETGIVGFLIYFGIWVFYLRLGWSCYRSHSRSIIDSVCRALFVSQLVLLAHSVYEDSPRRTAVLMFMAITFALLARRHLQEKLSPAHKPVKPKDAPSQLKTETRNWF